MCRKFKISEKRYSDRAVNYLFSFFNFYFLEEKYNHARYSLGKYKEGNIKIYSVIYLSY